MKKFSFIISFGFFNPIEREMVVEGSSNEEAWKNIIRVLVASEKIDIVSNIQFIDTLIEEL